jgi:outer membrane autotransporter protein
LSAVQAAQVLEELSSIEFYGSLANIRQNIAFTSVAERLTDPRAPGAEGLSLWFSPMGRFAKYDAENGVSGLKVDSYGGAFGIDMAYEGGAFGFGFGYAEHDARARGSMESGDVETYTLGLYWTQRFGDALYANAQFSYGFSKFAVERELTLLARTIMSDFKGNEWDGRVQLGYDFPVGPNMTATPFGELALRHWSMNGFTEEGGQAVGVAMNKASKTVFNPTVGVRLSTPAGMDAGMFTLRPYGELSYTFQDGVGARRTATFLGGGDSFDVKGIDAEGFGKIEAGINADMSEQLGLFLGLNYGFGGGQDAAGLQGGVKINF